ncbi:hypothetical protein AAC387_Pa06g3193 [Persea americana]
MDDGVAEVAVVVVVDERRAEEETVTRIEDGCVGGIGGQEAKGVISAAVLIISYGEITDGFIADGSRVSVKI